MNRKIRKAALLITIISSLTFLPSCERNEPHPPSHDAVADYFPLTESSGWEYIADSYSLDQGELLGSDTIALQVIGDSTLSGKTYKVISSQNPQGSTGFYIKTKLVRKEGPAYFGIHQDLYSEATEEYKFLDEDLPENSSWEFLKSEFGKTEYVIVAKDFSKTIKGIQYHNLIEVAVNYYYKQENEWVKNFSIHHVYAKGIGEIYAFYPYPSLTFSNIHLSLLKKNPPQE